MGAGLIALRLQWLVVEDFVFIVVCAVAQWKLSAVRVVYGLVEVGLYKGWGGNFFRVLGGRELRCGHGFLLALCDARKSEGAVRIEGFEAPGCDCGVRDSQFARTTCFTSTGLSASKQMDI